MKHLITIISALLLTGLLSCKKEDTTGKDLTILTEVLKPYNYVENGIQKGITTELVLEIVHDLGLSGTIKVSSSWDSIFNRLKSEENIMVFTTGLTAERKDQFKWAGPVAVWHAAFISLRSSGLSISGYEDAMKLPAVGVVTAYSSTDILRNLGFKNLVYFNSLAELAQNLFNGTVNLVFDDPGMLQVVAREQSLDASLMATLHIYSSTAGYLAFSRDVSDQIVRNWQDKLDQMKDNGFLQGLYDDYLPGSRAPGRILMFADENPPQTYLDSDGTIKGSSMEMADAMMEGSNLAGPVELTLWTNAYNQILLVPNSMAFSTLRSPDRESLFHWVGPVCKKRYCFFVQASSDYHIGKIDDARSMQSIGTVTGWASEQELMDLGFNNVVTWPTPQEVFVKLMDGDIQCAVLNDIAIRLLGSQTGHPPKDVRKEAVLSEGQTYLAFSKDTDAKYISAWEDAYNTLVSSGQLSLIWKNWYPDIDW